ncbi:DUF7536 family protein [Natronorarus salvus]|uniref:DUF7536 family protein n=1 Tax=Natronorarus salvus TaxID=3117733 RepID=UPI002F26959B
MTDDVPERPSLGAVLVELDAPRHFAVGLAIGVVFSLVLYVYRVFLVQPLSPTAETSPLLFAALAFVLAVTVGSLVAIVLTIRSAIRYTRSANETPQR